MKLSAILLTFIAATSPAIADDIFLACQGITTRNEGSRGYKSSPVIVQMRIDTTAGTLKLSGLSCWAGKGNCSALRLNIKEHSFYAFGDGKLTGSGYQTSIEVDRRSGYLKFDQAKDLLTGPATANRPVSETAELLCQGGSQARF